MTTPAFQVQKDDRTLWINGPVSCLGRVCPASAEVFLDSHTITLPFSHPSQVDIVWAKFKLLMLTHHGIPVDDSDAPPWLLPE